MIRLSAIVLIGTLCLTQPVRACQLALALLVDVSGSIDPNEYRFQMQGLADALEDPQIAHSLLQAQAALMVMQWSGTGEQEISIPWQRMLSERALQRFINRVRATPRRWSNSKTAIGDAVGAARATFPMVADCTRRVIDVSGDGQTNAGGDVSFQRGLARADGITINGVAIDRVGKSITQFYRNHVIIGPDSFVLTSEGYSDYPRAIAAKLFREIVRPGS